MGRAWAVGRAELVPAAWAQPLLLARRQALRMGGLSELAPRASVMATWAQAPRRALLEVLGLAWAQEELAAWARVVRRVGEVGPEAPPPSPTLPLLPAALRSKSRTPFQQQSKSKFV